MDSTIKTGCGIWSIIAERGRAHPESLALQDKDVALSYVELLDRAELIASHMAERWTGQIAGILIDRPVERLLAMLAVLRLGRGYCVIPSRANPELIAKLRTKFQCPLLVDDTCDESSRAFDDGEANVLKLPSPQGGLRPTVPRGSHRAPMAVSGPATAVYFTSGSTGEPKLIRRTQEQIVERTELYSRECGFTNSDRFVLMTHPGFVAAEGDIYGCLLNGGALYLLDPSELSFDEFSLWIRQNRISVLHPPVSYFQKWKRTWRTDERFPDLRCILLGGGGVPADLVEGIWKHLAPNALVHHRYSSTEAGPVASFCLRERGPQVSGQYLPIGTPFSFVEWKLRSDPGDSASEGELLVRSRCLSEDAPRDAQGYHHTGDWMRATQEGELVFLGRRDGLVKVRGYRVHLDGLSYTLVRQPGIDDARVVAWGGHSEQTQLVAFVVSKGGGTAAEIRQSLKKVLPRWQVPGQIVLLDKIPETPTGKHDVPELLRLLGGQFPGDCENLAANTEAQLESLWRAESRWRGCIDRNRPLLEHGGDSLMALGFLSRVERALSVHLTQLEFIRNPTVNQLANCIRSKRRPAQAGHEDHSRHLLPVNQEGCPPIVCLPWAGEPTIGDQFVAKEVEGKRTLYWMYPLGINGETAPLRTIGEQVDFCSEVIRRRLGERAVVLCGFSLGGILAYALATSGRLNVEQLILLDTQLAASEELLASSGGSRRRWLDQCRSGLRTLRLEWMSWHARRRRRPLPVRYRNRFFRSLNLSARRQFKPVTYSGPVHFIGSNGFDGEGIELRVHAWRELCADLAVSYVDTDHIGLFQYPHVRETANLILRSTVRANPTVPDSTHRLRNVA